MEQAPAALKSRAPAEQQQQRWSVHGATNAMRLDEWSQILATTHLSFDVCATAATPAVFNGAVTCRWIGDLRLVDCASSPWAGRRDRGTIGLQGPSAEEDVIGFQFVGKGVEVVREGGRQLTLTPGDVVLWDGHQPTEVEIVRSFHKRTLLFPRERVLGVCPRLAELRSIPVAERRRTRATARPLHERPRPRAVAA